MGHIGVWKLNPSQTYTRHALFLVYSLSNSIHSLMFNPIFSFKYISTPSISNTPGKGSNFLQRIELLSLYQRTLAICSEMISNFRLGKITHFGLVSHWTRLIKSQWSLLSMSKSKSCSLQWPWLLSNFQSDFIQVSSNVIEAKLSSFLRVLSHSHFLCYSKSTLSIEVKF